MKLYCVILVLVFGCVSNLKCESGFDAVFDDVMKYFNDQMKRDNMCVKGLHDVSITVTKKIISIIPIKAHVTATGGKVKDICTFRRSGDVKLTQTNQSTVTLSLGIDMNDLEVDYNDLKVKATIFYYKNFGSLKAIINKHTIEAQVTVSLPSTGSCSINLDFVQVTSLGDIHVYLNGKENSQFDGIANGAVGTIKNKVASVLESKIKSILSSEDVCKKIVEHGITLH